MSNVAELSKFIGKKAYLHTEKMLIEVEIIDARQVWDRIDFKVKPAHGEGTTWVSSSRVSVAEKNKEENSNG